MLSTYDCKDALTFLKFVRKMNLMFRRAAADSKAWFTKSHVSTVPIFTAATTKAFSTLAASHRHVDGPWLKIRDMVIARTSPGCSPIVLDLASRNDQPTSTLVSALPLARIIAMDVADGLVVSTTKSIQLLPTVEIALVDAGNLATHANGSIDVVTCGSGLMFPSNKPHALQEILRVLKPGGLLVTATWDHSDPPVMTQGVVKKDLEVAQSTTASDLISLSEPRCISDMLEEAGFRSINQTRSTYPLDMKCENDFHLRVGTLLIKGKIHGIGADDWENAERLFFKSLDKKLVLGPGGSVAKSSGVFMLTVASKAAAVSRHRPRSPPRRSLLRSKLTKSEPNLTNICKYNPSEIYDREKVRLKDINDFCLFLTFFGIGTFLFGKIMSSCLY